MKVSLATFARTVTRYLHAAICTAACSLIAAGVLLATLSLAATPDSLACYGGQWSLLMEAGLYCGAGSLLLSKFNPDGD